MVAIVVNRPAADANCSANYAINKGGWKSPGKNGCVMLVKPDRPYLSKARCWNAMNFNAYPARLTDRYGEGVTNGGYRWRTARGERQIRELIGRRQAGWGCGEILPTAQTGSRSRGSFPL